MAKFIAFLAAVGASLLLVGGVATALEDVSINPASVETGATFAVTVTREGNCGDVEVGIDEPRQVLGTLPDSAFVPIPDDPDSSEIASATFTAPNQPGTYTVYASDFECLNEVTTLVVVPRATTTTTSTTTTTTTTTTTLAPTTTAAAAVPPTPTTATPSATLPETGRASRNVLALAGLLTLAGGALVVARRNPRQA